MVGYTKRDSKIPLHGYVPWYTIRLFWNCSIILKYDYRKYVYLQRVYFVDIYLIIIINSVYVYVNIFQPFICRDIVTELININILI